MINVDISNIWGEVALPELLAIESEAAAAHEMLLEGTGAGSQCREWLDFSSRQQHPEMFRILLAAEQIRKDSDVCVVVGIGGSDLGARAAIELLQGPSHNLGKGKGNPRILFAGNSLSTRHWNEGMQLLKDQDFSVIVISRFGTDLESAILGFNTAIAQMMVFVNDVYKNGTCPREYAEGFIKMLSCITPHVGEELWQLLGHDKTIAYEPWPTYSEEKCKDSEVTIAVQVNGKMRGTVMMEADLDDDTVITNVLANEKIAAFLAKQEGQIRKTIVVKNKLVNLIVK